MKYYALLVFTLVSTLSVFAQANDEENSNTITTEWEIISPGKLQKKPLFKDPAISVRFIAEEGGSQTLNLALKYMFTDAVFDDAVPVEYYKNQKIEFNTDGGKFELSAAKYAKARRLNYVAQKVADMKVLFSGDLSFLKDNLVKGFTVHYAQGYQNINVSKEEAALLQEAYKKFENSLAPKQAKTKSTSRTKAVVKEVKEEVIKDESEPTATPINKLRKQAKRWGR